MRLQKKWKSEQSFKSRRKMRAMHLRELDDRKKSAEYEIVSVEVKVYSRLCPPVVINYLEKKKAAAVRGVEIVTLAKGKVIRWAEEKLFCNGGGYGVGGRVDLLWLLPHAVVLILDQGKFYLSPHRHLLSKCAGFWYVYTVTS